MSDVVKTLVQQLIGMKCRNVARRQPPEHPMHRVATAGADRAPTIDADEETIAFKHGRTHRPGAGAAAFHCQTIHVGAIGEIERHDSDIAELEGRRQRDRSRIAASSRSISRS